MTTIRIAGVTHDSIVDGPGLRCVVFAQGCHRNCPDCHNPQTHDPNGGEERSVESLWDEIRRNTLVTGLTISGGEPFLQAAGLAELAGLARAAGLNVWVYSGYNYAELLEMEGAKALLDNIDVLVDGAYVAEKNTGDLLWRGSDNQNIITLPR